eukprot:242042_1
MDLRRWIKDYVTVHPGKEHGTQRDFDDPNRSRLVQIVNIKKRGRFEPKSTGLDTIVSDGHVLINCKIIPQIVEQYENRIQNNVIIHLTQIEVRITCDFKSVYFVLNKMGYLNAKKLESICDKRSIQSINHMKGIQRLLRKYRSGVSFKFPPNPNGSKRKLFRFQAEMADVEARKEEVESLDLNELCSEKPHPFIKQKRSKSDKEEMEDDNEAVRTDRFIGNTCDWLVDLYPDIHNAPLALTLRRKLRPLSKPQIVPHTWALPPAIDHKPSPFKKKCIVTEYKEDVEGPDEIEDPDTSSGSQDYSQASWTSLDVTLCDMAVEKKQKDKELEFVFAKPMYSLKERIKAKARDAVKENVASDNNSNVVIQKAEEEESDDVVEMDEWEVSSDDDVGDMETNNVVPAVDHDDWKNKPINRQYLGLISANDLSRIRRYFIKLGDELNADSNTKPGNPFRGL